MTKATKTLIGAIAVAAIILVIAAATTPKSTVSTADLGSPATLTLVSPFGGTVEVGNLQSVEWTSSNYGAGTISINIIRKVSENPARYELVRNVAFSTLNDGMAAWVPALTDVGNDIFVEVACAATSQACTASQSAASLAVLDTGTYSNAAAVYQSLEGGVNY